MTSAKKVTIRPTKKGDLEVFDEDIKQSFRGVTAELDGEVVAITGVLHTRPMQCISALKEPFRRYPRQIVKMGQAVKKIMNSYTGEIYAYADPREKNSAKLLELVGFEYLYDHEDKDIGRVYLWPGHNK